MHMRTHTVVIGCTEHQVYSAEEALSLLEVGNAARITGATQMNQRSSRSHAIFTVHMGEDLNMHVHATCISSVFARF